MPDADTVIAELEHIASPAARAGIQRFFKGGDPKTTTLGVPFGHVFQVAKRNADLDLDQIERLLDDNRYEIRMAAVAIMDAKARRKRLPDGERKALFDLYLRRHDRINNWDLVDRAAPHVIGEYLIDKDRAVLDKLARSTDPHERRTAIVSTHALLKRGEVTDTFRIAAILADDSDPYIQKAVASWTREAGKRNESALIDFLNRNRNRLPRTTVTEASKNLPKDIRRRLPT
ncbi:MAG: DNA alkylation repair protein [Pseudomonadota bacterium]